MFPPAATTDSSTLQVSFVLRSAGIFQDGNLAPGDRAGLRISWTIPIYKATLVNNNNSIPRLVEMLHNE